ncbi:hypothetical protein SADUNF_Sadunf10G0101000 [Salix dunnii]|uniref:Uncharacterized protein n=1 Tax=Salix dunnii TaxID=1413687 RepID=A0A835MYG2_9ROSI|nr:hypothetical protein SADUNF_Sadunf10G0101000 [Salix dunnii]
MHNSIDSNGDNSSPSRLSLNSFLCKPWIHEKIRQLWVSNTGLLDMVQKDSINNATTFPNSYQLPQFQIPTLYRILCASQVHTLGIAAYFGCMYSLHHIMDQFYTINHLVNQDVTNAS